MKIRTVLLLLFFYTITTGYGFASAEEALPHGVKNLITLKKTAEVSEEAKRLSEAGNPFLANLAYGEAFLLQGDLDKAEAFFTKARELNPIGVEGKIGIAKVLAAKKEVDKAIKLLSESLRTSPQPVRLYYEMGIILEAAGDLKGASQAFQQGLERFFAKK
jgi:tetratricopeptide (TPR) repeat protein